MSEGGLTSDQLGTANALFAMISAIAAAWAVIVASREAREGREERTSDRRRDLYNRVVVDPLLRIVPEFASDVTVYLEGETGLADLTNKRDNPRS